MRWTLTFSAVLLAALATNCPTALAQQMGSFGSRSVGSTLSGGGRSAFGSSFGGMGMGGMGMGGMGMSSMGMGLGGMSSGMGMGGLGSSMGMGMSGSGLSGQSGFVGVNQSQLTGRGFVGANQLNGAMGQGGMSGLGGGMSGVGGGMSGLGGGMSGLGLGGMSGLGNRSSSMYPNNSQQYPGGQGYPRSGSTASTIRTVLTVDFDRRADAPPQLNSAVAKRLTGLPGLHWNDRNRVEMHGRTAVLRGVVATEHDRDLAERVTSLEASVDQVDNQLVVAPSSTKPAASSTAADPAEPAQPR